MSIGKSLPYRSPISKLLRFFCRSRDNWKAKCKEAKRENKSLKYRLTKMTENRDRWKAVARESAQRDAAEKTPAEDPPSKNRARAASCHRRSRRARPVVAAAR